MYNLPLNHFSEKLLNSFYYIPYNVNMWFYRGNCIKKTINTERSNKILKHITQHYNVSGSFLEGTDKSPCSLGRSWRMFTVPERLEKIVVKRSSCENLLTFRVLISHHAVHKFKFLCITDITPNKHNTFYQEKVLYVLQIILHYIMYEF